MFRIDKSSVSYKKDERPFVLAHAAMMRPAPAKPPQFPELADKEEAAREAQAPAAEARGGEKPQSPADTPEVVIDLPDPAELLAKARKEADAIVAEAKAKAEASIAQAKLAADEMRQKAEQEGADLGYTEGFAKGRGEGAVAYYAASRDAQKLAADAVAHIEQERSTILAQVEKQCVELSVDVAEKVVGTALKLDENAFPALIRRALDEIMHEGRVTVRVSPLEYDIFFSQDAGWLSDESRAVHVIPEEGLREGDLKLESDIESINAGVREQMNAIRKAVAQLGGEA